MYKYWIYSILILDNKKNDIYNTKKAHLEVFWQIQKNEFTISKYHKLTDEQIIDEIKNGNEEALVFLLEKYKDLVNSKVGKYFIIGAEREDTIQEGMIGLF